MEATRHCRIAVALERPPADIPHRLSVTGVRPSAQVTVGCGPSFGPWVAGKTVAHVRLNLATAYNIHPEAIPVVGGEVVGEDYVLRSGDDLSFHQQSGGKGVGEYVWTEEQFCKLFQITSEQFWEQVTRGLRVLRFGDGSVRITETAVDEFIRGKAVDSPYLSTDEAAAYCNLTKDAFYGRVERKKIVPLPGSGKENRFTREQSDQMMRGES